MQPPEQQPFHHASCALHWPWLPGRQPQPPAVWHHALSCLSTQLQTCIMSHCGLTFAHSFSVARGLLNAWGLTVDWKVGVMWLSSQLESTSNLHHVPWSIIWHLNKACGQMRSQMIMLGLSLLLDCRTGHKTLLARSSVLPAATCFVKHKTADAYMCQGSFSAGWVLLDSRSLLFSPCLLLTKGVTGMGCCLQSHTVSDRLVITFTAALLGQGSLIQLLRLGTNVVINVFNNKHCCV